jgi:hypothetical protein
VLEQTVVVVVVVNKCGGDQCRAGLVEIPNRMIACSVVVVVCVVQIDRWALRELKVRVGSCGR